MSAQAQSTRNMTRIAVTGATSTLGAAIVRAIAPYTGHLLLHLSMGPGRKARELTEVVREVAPRCRIEWLVADFTDEEQVETLCAHLASAGPLHGLVNNAGVHLRKSLAETARPQWQRLLDINVTAPARLLAAAGEAHCRRVINLLDIGARLSWPNHAAYCASKAALESVTRTAALELAPNTSVNAVAPGVITVPEGMPVRPDQMARKIPLGRLGRAEEIAETVRWLLFQAPAYLTGQVIAVDGGLSLR